MRTVVAFLAAAMAIVWAPPTGAEMLGAELEVGGIACPFCAFGIEKKLRSVSGVEDVTVFLDDGRIELRLASGNATSARDLAGAVEKAGFELSRMDARVRGVLSEDGNDLLLEAGAEVRFRVVAGDGLPPAGSGVVLNGTVADPSSLVPTLEVHEVSSPTGS